MHVLDPPPARDFGRRDGWWAALLGLLVVAVFLPALRHDFVYYDDNGYVLENPWVARGLTWDNIVHAFRTTEIAYWHPLTWISHLADVELFGLRPWGHHLTSVLWHGLNTAILYLLLRRLTGAVGRSAMVAALFGLHPLHVESVAWVAERKDVLSTFFALVTVWCYATWVRRKAERRPDAWRAYAGALAAFAAGLMSKPMVVTVPCLLLLLDFWPLWRFELGSSWRGNLAAAGRLVVEKLPFLALSAAASVAAVQAQALLGTLQTTERLSVIARLANAAVAYLLYLEKCFWPVKLAVFYPHPGALPWWQGAGAAAVLVAASTLAVWQLRRRPYLFVGWCWFLGLLVPVIGIVQVGGQAMADRYSYLALVGIFIALCWGVAEVATFAGKRTWLPWFAAAVIAACLAQTTRQLARWQDSRTLFQHALAVTERNWAAYFSLGYYYSKSPEHLDEAIAAYREVVRIVPTAAEGHFSLAAMLARKRGAETEAIREFRAALRLAPDKIEARIGLAQVLLRQPDGLGDALAELARVRETAPGNLAARDLLTKARVRLGEAQERRGRPAEAVAAYRGALELVPDDPDALLRLADVLAGDAATLDEAIAGYRRVLALRPDWVEVRNNLGIALASRAGGESEALAEYEALLRAKPGFADGHSNLANLFARLPGKAADAAREYETALRLQPGDFRVHFNYGRFLLDFPERRAEAVAHFEAALRLQPDLAPAREILERLRASR